MVSLTKKKKFFISNGLGIAPDDIESAYMAAAPVSQMCVFDIPSPKGKDDVPVLWAVVVPDMKFFKNSDAAHVYKAIKTAVEKASRRISIPERLMGFSVTLDELPRTAMGKIRRREVRRRYLSAGIKEMFRPAGKDLTDAEIRIMNNPEAEKVIDCLKARTAIENISPADSFELDLGINLLGRSELAFELEKSLGLKIKEEEINRVFTVGELIKHVGEIGAAKKDAK